ncbi:MAG: hypothetical protein RBS45_04570 [Anaerolineales bacterium]|jgi:hypothetical protein|nr:hypothetical protein [Anaerolineales bacterium]GER80982.1 hypothetical protein DIM_30630 [Candidatus Denitrolinea symbiosum]
MRKIKQKAPNKTLKSAGDLLLDFLKNTLWGLLTLVIDKYLMSLFGVSFLAAIMILLIALWKWVVTPITLPAYIVAVIFFSIIGGVKLIQQIQLRRRTIIYRGLLWKIGSNNLIIGPFCPKCKKRRLDNKFDQISNAANRALGQESKYFLVCACGYHITVNVSPSVIEKELQEIINKTPIITVKDIFW